MEMATHPSKLGVGIFWIAASSLSDAPGKFRCTICDEVLDVFEGPGRRYRVAVKPDAKVNMDQLTSGKPAVSDQTAAASMLSIRAVMLGDRISPSALEIGTLVSSTPIAFRIHAGLVVIFRYGVVVLIGLSPSEGTALIETLISRVIGELSSYEEESARAQLCNDQSAEVILPGGRILSQRI